MAKERYRGSFADGNTKQHVKQGTLMGDFAAGQETEPRVGTVQPRGSYADGVRKQPVDPAAPRGDFAEGERTEPRD
jgi:hypothetical protein